MTKITLNWMKTSGLLVGVWSHFYETSMGHLYYMFRLGFTFYCTASYFNNTHSFNFVSLWSKNIIISPFFFSYAFVICAACGFALSRWKDARLSLKNMFVKAAYIILFLHWCCHQRSVNYLSQRHPIPSQSQDFSASDNSVDGNLLICSRARGAFTISSKKSCGILITLWIDADVDATAGTF